VDAGQSGQDPLCLPHGVCAQVADRGRERGLGYRPIASRPDALVHELTFPMSTDAVVLAESWRRAAEEVLCTLEQGEDAAFLTLGDSLLYSTYIYLLRRLREIRADIAVVTVPGITAMSAAAALTNFPIGQGKQLVTIVPRLRRPRPVRPGARPRRHRSC